MCAVQWVANTINILLWNFELTKTAGLGAISSDQFALHNFAQIVQFPGIGVYKGFAKDKTSKANIVELELFDFSARKCAFVGAHHPVVTHERRIIEVHAGELDVGIIVA